MVQADRIGRNLYYGLLALIAVSAAAPAVRADQAADILKTAEIKGGLVVHVGCGNGRLTAALRSNDSYLVHGLVVDAKDLERARAHIQSLGVYGLVSVDRFDGKKLPYIDNTVNLVVASDLGHVPMDEVTRVLTPLGVACVKQGDKWVRIVKPRPGEIDAWTHYMHGPDGNAVAGDTVVAPPRRLQWQGGPRWGRHHEHMSSISACVATERRLFYIFDEATRVSILTPAEWKLIARDAFNGKILWKRDIPKWFDHVHSLKSGPAILPRRLVAVGERVYTTLGITAPLTALDAATGKTLLAYKGSESTQEVIVSDGVVFLIARKGAARRIWELDDCNVMAFAADTGKLLWKQDMKVLPMTLAADAKGVYLHDGDKIVARGRKSGKQLWASDPVACSKAPASHYGATLVVSGGVVMFTGSKDMSAIDAGSGKTIWTHPHPPSGYKSPGDMFIIDGKVLAAQVTGGRMGGVVTGRDLKTGEVKVEFPPDVKNYWFHHRCHRGKATVNYLLTSRTGVEFIDFRKKHWQVNQWVRGACLYGIMPANGLLYAPIHPCACYPESKTYGFSALAPGKTTEAQRSKGDPDSRGYPVLAPAPAVPEPTDAERLEKGPAYDAGIVPGPAGKSDWPTFRGDMDRGGRAGCAMPAGIKPGWQTEIGGKLSSFVIAEGKLVVASVDSHTVHALDAANGKKAWTFVAGGRVDSPPTIYKGRAIFGCADGYAYCLRMSDGELIWRFRLAPADRRLVSMGRIESVWPTHGATLLLEDRVYCVAGRSMFLDGGLRMVQLDPKTGRKIAEKLYDDRHPETGRTLQSFEWSLDMPVALPRILSSDGKHVFMGSQLFDLKGNRDSILHRPANEGRAKRQRERYPGARTTIDKPGKGVHIIAPYGFLEDAYHHRSYWVHGRGYDGGYQPYNFARGSWPSGKILAVGDDTVYGFGHKQWCFGWGRAIEHELFGDVKGAGKDHKRTRRWQVDLPLFVRAMVLAGDTLFVTGPPDVVDEKTAVEKLDDPQVQAQLARQRDAWNGKEGALLWAISPKDGSKLAEYKLDALPVFDTMAAANGRLYFATADGKVRCYTPK